MSILDSYTDFMVEKIRELPAKPLSNTDCVAEGGIRDDFPY